jgi:hypothetical protein
MKAIILKGIVLCVLVMLSLSCKKSSSSAAAKSKTEYLSQGTWKILSVGVDLNKDGIVDADATGYVQSCHLDDTYAFRANGTGTIDEGATKCNASDPQSSDFTWVFKNNETILSGNFGLVAGDATIITLNDTKLVLSFDYTYNGTSYRLIATLQH